MKTKISSLTFILCLWAFSLTISASSHHSLPITIGYLVAIESRTEKLEITRTIDLIDVYTLAGIHFPGNCVDFAAELHKSVYYEIGGQQKTFYVEVKRISRNGKYRRLSNRQFSQIVKTHQIALTESKQSN